MDRVQHLHDWHCIQLRALLSTCVIDTCKWLLNFHTLEIHLAWQHICLQGSFEWGKYMPTNTYLLCICQHSLFGPLRQWQPIEKFCKSMNDTMYYTYNWQCVHNTNNQGVWSLNIPAKGEMVRINLSKDKRKPWYKYMNFAPTATIFPTHQNRLPKCAIKCASE